MTNEQKQKKLEDKIKELFAFTKDKKVAILAVQKLSEQGYLETVPMFRDLEEYPDDVKITDVEATPK